MNPKRTIVFFDEEEKQKLKEYAKSKRMSLSGFVGLAAIEKMQENSNEN